MAPSEERSRAAPDCIAGRYRLRAPLGQGASGAVWEAEDTLSSDRERHAGTPPVVAIKLFDAGHTHPARVRREIAALRMLRLPGVVRLLDEGEHRGRAFLVMERIAGAPFPGRPLPCAWADIAALATALLEVLARVHAAGVVHRDLKPANVLVSADGRPTLVDFGIALDTAYGPGLTRTGQILGTPAYLAPEQIRGEAITAQTDLYAAGAMLYQALSGHLPHEADHAQGLLRARLSQRPAPLALLAPAVPAAVAALIDALLADEPADRPRSAPDALARLHGPSAPLARAPTLPWLGSDAPVRALVEAARAGRSVDLVGPAGAGRTRCLREACAALAQEGRRIVWLLPGTRAFTSLEPLVGTLADQGERPLRAVETHVEARVRLALAGDSAGDTTGDTGGRTIVVADRAEGMDRWSAATLARSLDAGTVLRAWRSDDHVLAADGAVDVVRLAPLGEADLAPLFAAPDRILHLRTDAARALWRRTQGRPAWVESELVAWVRAGIARWDGDRMALARDAMDRLASGVSLELRVAHEHGPVPDLPHLHHTLAWVALAVPHATAALLATATGQALWRVEEALDELLRLGAVITTPAPAHDTAPEEPRDTRYAPRYAIDSRWPAARRQQAHRTLGALLPPGAEGRLMHLVAGEAPGIAAEADALAERYAREGNLGRATAVLAEGLLATRRHGRGSPADERRMLARWVDVALAEMSAPALDRVLYELTRAAGRERATITAESSPVDALAQLVQAALAVLGGASERAMDLACAVPPLATADLERRRHQVLVMAARRCSSLDREAAIVAEAAAWAEAAGDARSLASRAGWLGRLRYRQGRFEEAAALHAEAAAMEPWTTARIAALLSSASALMEAFHLDQATARVEEAHALAAACRQPRYEARAEWLLRALAYRAGRATQPDRELVELAPQLGVVELEALVCFTEAAVAFRAGAHDEAADLAERARVIWHGQDRRWPGLLAHALTLAAGRPAPADTITGLAERACACPIPGLGVQILGLLGRVWPASLPRPVAAAEALAASVPRASWGARMEMLSVDESLAWARRATASPPCSS